MFDGGFSATSLAVFTALAPAGAVAFACLAAFLLVNRSQSRDWRGVLAHLLFIPLAIAWVGFIASATHLGTPANALHAINGLGVRRFLTKWCRPWRFCSSPEWHGCIPTAKSRKRL